MRYHTYVHVNVQKFLEGFRYDAHPMGMLLGAVGRALDVLPGREGHRRRREPASPAGPARREDADDRGVRVPPLARAAVRAAAERPRLHRQLRQHDVRDRRPPRAEPGAPARARDPADPPRRPRAELLDERRARRRLVAGRPVLGRVRGNRRPVRAAPRRRERGRPADARRDRRHEERPGLHRAGQGRARPADGLRPPRLQELRPAREAHQARRGRRLRADRPQPEARDRARARADRARGRVLRLAPALPERRLLLGAHLPGDGLPDGLLHRALRPRPPAGLDRAVGGAPLRPRAEDLAPAPDLHGRRTSARTSPLAQRG